MVLLTIANVLCSIVSTNVSNRLLPPFFHLFQRFISRLTVPNNLHNWIHETVELCRLVSKFEVDVIEWDHWIVDTSGVSLLPHGARVMINACTLVVRRCLILVAPWINLLISSTLLLRILSRIARLGTTNKVLMQLILAVELLWCTGELFPLNRTSSTPTPRVICRRFLLICHILWMYT